MTAPMEDKPIEQVSRPWTPGEWYASERRGVENGTGNYVRGVFSKLDDGVVLVGYACDSDDCEIGDMDADAELIALAPEMAEAILAWSAQRCDCNIVPGPPEDSYICPRCDSMGGIAAKLRAIGASDA